MVRYSDIDRDSGVISYEKGPDYIEVTFKGGSTYLYTDTSAGTHNIAQMKILADRGDGLNAYINKYVKELYVK